MNQPLFDSPLTLQMTGPGGYLTQWGDNLQQALNSPMFTMGLGLLTNGGRATPGLMQSVQNASRLGMAKEDREDKKKREERESEVLMKMGGQAGLLAQLSQAQGAATLGQEMMPQSMMQQPPGMAGMMRPPMMGAGPPGPGMQAAMGGPPRPFPSGPPSLGPPGSSPPSTAGIAETLLSSGALPLQRQGLGLLTALVQRQEESLQPRPLTSRDFVKVTDGRFVNLRTGQITPWSLPDKGEGPVLPFPGKSDFGRQGNLMFQDDMRKLGIASPTIQQAQAWGAEFSRRKLERPTTLVTDAGHQEIPGVAVRGIAQAALGGMLPRGPGRSSPGLGAGLGPSAPKGGAGPSGLPRGFTPKRLTDAEKKAIQAGDVLSGASQDLLELEGLFDATGLGAAARRAIRGLPGGDMAARAMTPEAAQAYEDTGKQWVTRHIFDVSGATAREDEKLEAFRTYFPQPGDKPLAVAKKTRDRMRRAVEAYRKGLRTKRYEGEEQQRVRRQMEIMQVELGRADQSYRQLLEQARRRRNRGTKLTDAEIDQAMGLSSTPAAPKATRQQPAPIAPRAGTSRITPETPDDDVWRLIP